MATYWGYTYTSSHRNWIDLPRPGPMHCLRTSVTDALFHEPNSPTNRIVPLPACRQLPAVCRPIVSQPIANASAYSVVKFSAQGSCGTAHFCGTYMGKPMYATRIYKPKTHVWCELGRHRILDHTHGNTYTTARAHIHIHRQALTHNTYVPRNALRSVLQVYQAY